MEEDGKARLLYAAREFLSSGKRNVGLVLYNVNGKAECEKVRNEVFKIVEGPVRPHGVILVDPRVASSRVAEVEAFWKARFQGRNVIVTILASVPPDGCSVEKAMKRSSLVGGSILLFFPTPGVKLISTEYDPSGLGIVTRVTIGIGRFKRLQWLGVYVPSGSGTSAACLNKKAERWYDTNRRDYVSDEERAAEASPFTGHGWAWALITHYVCRFAKGDHHIGSIVSGDFNQQLDVDDHSPDSLFSRTSEIGLVFSLQQYLHQHGVLPYNTYHCMAVTGGTFIDSFFSNIPLEFWRGGGSPPPGDVNKASDHLPVHCSFYLEEAGECERVSRKATAAPVKLDVSTPKRRDAVKVAIAEFYEELRPGLHFHRSRTTSSDDLGRTLEFLSRQVVDIAAAVAKKTLRPSSLRNCSVVRIASALRHTSTFCFECLLLCGVASPLPAMFSGRTPVGRLAD
jgi:hypothetical protein